MTLENLSTTCIRNDYNLIFDAYDNDIIMLTQNEMIAMGNNSIIDNPNFINVSEHNFNLQFNSPCIDEGNPYYPFDPDGSRADIGAFNFVLSEYVSGCIENNDTYSSPCFDPLVQVHPTCCFNFTDNCSELYTQCLENPQEIEIEPLKVNLISYYVDREYPSVLGFLGDFQSDFIAMENDNNQKYYYPYGIDEITSINHSEGYSFFKAGNDVESITVYGEPLDIINSRLEPNKYNYLPYSLEAPLPVDILLNVFSDSNNGELPIVNMNEAVLVLSSDDGGYYVPMFGINNINNLKQGEAYKVYLALDHDVQYSFDPNNYTIADPSQFISYVEPEEGYESHKYSVHKTGVPYPIIITELGDVSRGDEIVAYVNNIPVGATPVSGPNDTLLIAAWGSIEFDDYTSTGWQQGDLIQLRKYDNLSGKEHYLEYELDNPKYGTSIMTVGSLTGCNSNNINPWDDCEHYGCTDPEALNFDSSASHDNGKCVYILGDLNGDNQLDILDLQIIVNIILGVTPLDDNLSFAVDVNGDGAVNSLDIVAIVNTIIGGDANDNSGTAGEILISKVLQSIDDGDADLKMSITMLNESVVKALHMKVKLEEGYTPVTAEKGEKASNMDMDYKVSADKSEVAFVLYGKNGESIPTGSGVVFDVKLKSNSLGRGDDDPDSGDFLTVELANSDDSLLPYTVILSDEMGRYLAENSEDIIPMEYSLSPVYPNPFNPVTTIPFSLPEESHVNISVFDIQGRKVEELVSDNLKAGNHNIEWTAKSYSTGVYLVNMKSNNYNKTQKVLLLK